MSTSTVSITADPSTATRRRPVEKKPVDFADTNNFSTVAAAAAALDSARLSVGDTYIRTETSRDAVLQIKKPSSNNAVAQRRPSNSVRKAGSHHEKSKWLTVISIFVKNSLLLAALLGLVLLSKFVLGPRGQVKTNVDAVLPDGSGNWEMQKYVDSMAKTVKMMQLQVDVLDKKIGEEVGKVRNDINEKLEGISLDLEEKLKELNGRTVNLEKFTAELTVQMEKWLSKEELNEFLQEFNNGKSHDVVDLEDIRVFAKGIVEREIEKHAADGVGRVDYALASGGAMVVKHSEPFVGPRNRWFSLTERFGTNHEAEKMLRPSFGEPGQCFALKGSQGFVQVKLRTAIIPEAVTLEHVAETVAYNRSSAPKDCRISGWLQGQDLVDSMADTEKMNLLTEFTYELDNSNIQTFGVVDSARSNTIDTIRFDFTSNHGSPTHTCIYRLRVHGQEPISLSMSNIDA